MFLDKTWFESCWNLSYLIHLFAHSDMLHHTLSCQFSCKFLFHAFYLLSTILYTLSHLARWKYLHKNKLLSNVEIRPSGKGMSIFTLPISLVFGPLTIVDSFLNHRETVSKMVRFEDIFFFAHAVHLLAAPCKDALTMSFAFLILTFVFWTIWKVIGTFSIRLIIFPITDVITSIVPNLSTFIV